MVYFYIFSYKGAKMIEAWKPIRDYEDRYEVSNLGRVRCLKSRVNVYHVPKIIKGSVFKGSQTFYNRVQLSNPSKRFLVHRLVGEAFVDNPDSKPQINHIDNNGLNNCYTNLEWTTQSENLIHAQKQGRLYDAQAKGGYATTALNKETAVVNAKSLVGKTFGDWAVTAYAGPVKVGNVEREYVTCKCKCGSITDIYYSSLIENSSSKSCKTCSYQKIKHKAFTKITEAYTDKVLRTYRFTGKLIDVTEATTTKTLKMEVVCTICDTTSSLLYNKVIGDRIRKCQCQK
jgi:hypothetical protein